jgi:ppGpp synthetase/RelA/SpoT-type nucleotidyltranferase
MAFAGAVCNVAPMPWARPENSKNQVNKAGDVVAGRAALSDMGFEEAMDVAGNWRSAHGYPLHKMYQCLARAAKRVDQKALVSKRQKRMPSIVAKLQRFEGMQLARIQDLGGCRAVVADIEHVNKLVSLHEGTDYEHFEREPKRKKDYIARPKDDGYRSVHLIYKYTGESQGGAFKGLTIEVQIRSRLQHAWATALETIDAFTGQGLKAHLRTGTDQQLKERWERFFLLVSILMAGHGTAPIYSAQ